MMLSFSIGLHFQALSRFPPKFFQCVGPASECELGPVSLQPESQQPEPKGQTKPVLSGAVCKHPHLKQTDNL